MKGYMIDSCYDLIQIIFSMLWNAIKEGLKLKLGAANPYKIKPQFCLLTDKPTIINAHFLQKQQINRNSYLIRVQLPDPNKCLGLMIGQYVKIIAQNQTKRQYNPVSRIDEPGIVDFLIRDMRKENDIYSFTNQLLNMKEGEQVKIYGPFTQYIYRGYGQLQWTSQPLKKYKHIGVIAYESGITGAYTLIDSLMPNYDNTAISLLWIGQEIDDFIFIQEYSTLSEQLKLNCNLMLRNMRPGWIGPYGTITKSHISSFMPPPFQQTALILMGRTKEVQSIEPMLRTMGYNNIMRPIQS